MFVVRRTMANLLEHYQGALVGALVGDCLGAPFEFRLDKEDYARRMEKITHFFKKVDAGKKAGKCEYTDDTAMLRSVAQSLINCKKVDVKDLSQRFTEEFFLEPYRGYGSNIPVVFHELRKTEFKDPFGPASKQFDGRGSYGNGGAMRIAPSALFGLYYSETEFNELVTDITRVTHANKAAINGAIFEASAVQLALKSSLSDVPFSADHIVKELLDLMQRLENFSDKKQSSEKGEYSEKLNQMVEFLHPQTQPDVDTVAEELGNDVSALHSVPSAVFSFLRTFDKTLEEWEKVYNPFQRTIIYAISLSGDTDTIASMAGAIAGAYYGISCIPEEWQKACEGLEDAKTQAQELYELAQQKKQNNSSHL